MKATIALTVASAALLSACTTRVIERPVPMAQPGPSVVTTPAISERVVERGPAPAAAGSTSPAACMWASQTYSSGAISCQENAQFRCNNGSWERTGPAC
jgi:hypothetical protein